MEPEPIKHRLEPPRLNRRFSKNRRRRRYLNDEADKLAEAAATGDVDAVKDQFGKVSKTCKSCHDK
jgi:cytochrome c556